MPQTDRGTRALPLGSPMAEIDEYVMCAVPALSRAALYQTESNPFRVVHIVLAVEVSAELAELSARLQTVEATPFIGFQPGRWWRGKIPVILGPPPGLPVNSVSSLCGISSAAFQQLPAAPTIVPSRSQPQDKIVRPAPAPKVPSVSRAPMKCVFEHPRQQPPANLASSVGKQPRLPPRLAFARKTIPNTGSAPRSLAL